MKVTIDSSKKIIEVSTEGDLTDFNNLTIEILKTIEKCKNIITIPNNTSTTGIPKSNVVVDYDKTTQFLKTHCVKTNFQ